MTGEQAAAPAAAPAPAAPAPGAIPEIVGISPEFPVEFEQPGDERLTWDWDDMHYPVALAPLAADYIAEVIGPGFNERYRLHDVAMRVRPAIWNGYAYYALEFGVPEADVPAVRAKYLEARRARIAITRTWWDQEALPELARLYDGIRAIPVETSDGPSLALAWARAWADTLRAWEIHFIAIMGPYQVLGDLSDAYSTAVGASRDAEALALIRGAHHELEDVEAGSEALARLAGANPEVARRLTATPPPTREELAALPGGPAFVAALDEFLGRHGHLGHAHDDLSLASWAEDPSGYLAKLGSRLAHPPAASSEREARHAREAEDLANLAREKLQADPAALAEFERLLAQAREIGHLTEVHNYWIDRMAQARLRELVMRVGARLARDGAIEHPDDVFFLHRAEVQATLAEGLDQRALVARRREEHERHRALNPPPTVGRAPGEQTANRFDGERFEPIEANLLRGTGASAGIVRGPARVALSQDDFGRILPGDVIVCPSSNPSWVPVFTIAAGLVTNTGGVLSHAAVVAREFGLPAVVGVAHATTTIQDGQLLEIDGTAGTVRLL